MLIYEKWMIFSIPSAKGPLDEGENLPENFRLKITKVEILQKFGGELP